MMEVFAAASLAGLTFKNRIIRAATHEGLGDNRGLPDARLSQRYVRLAEGGVGGIITGYAGVHPAGRTWPNMLMIDSYESVAAWRQVTAAVKPYGVPLILQLAHGGALTDPAVTGSPGKAPSRHRYKTGRTAEALTDIEIEAIIAAFVRAIARAELAGFDGVEIHAAHGYLLSAFLSPLLNRRQDRWGGSSGNRCRIIGEIIGRARETVGKYPILVKISAYDDARGGMQLNESIRLARLLQQASCDAVEVSCGNDEWFCTVRSPQLPLAAILALQPELRQASWLKRQLAKLVIPRLFNTYEAIEDYNVAAAAEIKANLDIPVIVVGGIRKYSTIAAIIGQGQADLVAMCRPFIIEPDIVNKMQAGQQPVSRCLNCNYCLIGVTHSPLRCYHGQLPGTPRP
jgi:2,4-dienoyl-CoA reductase-like NADH-dependent reductase (Old Yellow Enzyme family)